MLPSAVLEIQSDKDARQFRIVQSVVAIGRSMDNQLALQGPLVSRRHARIEWAEGAFHITDLGSANGTQVNGVEIEPRVWHPLKEGDTIHVGGFTLVLLLSEGQQEKTLVLKSEETVVVGPEPTVAIVPAVPRVVVSSPQGTREVSLERDTLTLGRDPDNDIVVGDAVVSRRHAELRRVSGGYEITDLGSANGLMFRSRRIATKLLADGDVLWISEAVSLTYKGPADLVLAHGVSRKVDLRGKERLSIGRQSDNDLILDHPSVSRHHARVLKRDDAFVVEDLGSTNGTFVNGERLPAGAAWPLWGSDSIHVGPIKLAFALNTLVQFDESRDLRLDALHLNHYVGKGIRLLQDISLSINPREFIAIVGVSGAGKTTLSDALSGFRPSREGAVLVNGTDLYRNFDVYRSSLGYVPQEDIIHKELTVYQAMDYAARLRLPSDTTAEERRDRVVDVLQTLDLTDRRDVPIQKLSGGQRKRVSIGVELLTRPGLFFLDEATSGLDPGTEAQMMRLLRKLADLGHTILIVTHATKNVMLCDQVAFLAKGGHLAYYGPPDRALSYFGVQDFDSIYEKLESELTPKDWADQYRRSGEHREFVTERLREAQAGPRAPREHASAWRTPKTPVSQASSLRQLVILSQRNLSILLRDRLGLALMLMVAPLIGALDLITSKKGLFATQGGDAVQALTSLFLLALICILVGAISSMREIVKEGDIYRRERMVTLRIWPYVLSKVWVGVLLALYQSAVFLAAKKLATGWPGTPQVMLEVYLTLVLATLSGMLMGFVISAMSPNQNVVPLLVIIVLVPQFMFAGGIFPITTFGPAGKVISKITTTKWTFEALVSISGIGHDVAQDACWQLPKADRNALSVEEKASRCTCMGPNLFQTCDFPGLSDLYDHAVAASPPAQPSKPPPSDGQHSDQRALEQYQRDMETWVVRYQQWKERHDRATGEAEGLIARVYDDFGAMFKVSLAHHWGWLFAITAVLFGLVLVAQRRKDVV